MNAGEAYRTCVEITIRDGDRGSINMSFRDGPQDQTSHRGISRFRVHSLRKRPGM